MAVQRPTSRPRRWADACERAAAAIADLKELQEEYQEWYDSLPEGLDATALADKLSEVCDLDLEGAQDTVEEATNADLPLGFGRD